MSVLKYMDQHDGGEGKKLFWSRAHLDGAPFRSAGPPMPLKDAEYDERVQRVYDTKVRKFDLSDPEQLEAYQDILDKQGNGWYILVVHKLRFNRKKEHWLALCVWREVFQEQIRGNHG